MEYYKEANIDPKDYQEALESMSADIFINRDNDKWTAEIHTNIGNASIKLFSRNNYKTSYTAELGIGASWRNLKGKFNSNTQLK